MDWCTILTKGINFITVEDCDGEWEHNLGCYFVCG